MTGPNENDPDENGGLYGPSESDIERFNREDAEYLDERRRDARSALWKLVAGGVFILLAASMLLNVLLPAVNRTRNLSTGPERVPAIVTRVFDGRTIGVSIDGVEQTVRYIGVDTPAFGDPLYDLAIAANRQWIFGEQVLLEADERDADGQGRLLRYVWLDGAMINLNLVAVGLSRAIASGENDRYMELFRQTEDAARAQDIGIWENEGPQRSASDLPAGIESLPHGARSST